MLAARRTTQSSLIITFKLERVHGIVNQASLIRSTLLLSLLMPEVLASDLHTEGAALNHLAQYRPLKTEQDEGFV